MLTCCLKRTRCVSIISTDTFVYFGDFSSSQDIMLERDQIKEEKDQKWLEQNIQKPNMSNSLKENLRNLSLSRSTGSSRSSGSSQSNSLERKAPAKPPRAARSNSQKSSNSQNSRKNSQVSSETSSIEPVHQRFISNQVSCY